MPSSPTMASSDKSRVKHDVFISFRGKDVRRGFLSHLVKELDRENIVTYVDDKLKGGEEISSALLTAIKESQISIVIFSKNYASSRWCLNELVEIVKCMKVNKQVVLPVFYYIEPSHVRHQIHTYKKAFADHEVKFPVGKKKLQSWRSALKHAADRSGHVATYCDNDSELVDKIVKDVLVRLKDNLPNESKGLVGIDQHLDRIRSFLEMESKEVQILGIWGMSGIGKTTIAQVAFDKFSSNYEGSYFLDNVREESQKHGLKSLRQKLISELQQDRSPFLPKRLTSRKQVLIVLDDVSTPEQLQSLVTEGIRWGPGSRVIVTSKDRKVLLDGGVHAKRIHEVKELDFEDSLQLFCSNAFKNSHPEKGYEELSRRAVNYAKGLPLALKVLGSCLYSVDREIWECTLRKLEMYPNPKIQNVLKMSIDGLGDVEREIFLDIAFFYKGEVKHDVMRLLDANNLFAACGIKALIDKAIISVSSDNIIQMHDLIQDMGWERVRQESENPGKRSRLKDFEEVYDVLMNNKGTDAIKGIVLYASLFKDVRLNADTFKNMTNLRVIKFYSPWHVRPCNVHQSTSLESFSNELRVLEWNGYPYKSLPLSFYPKKLNDRSMPNSRVKELWKLVQDYVFSSRKSLGRTKQSMEVLDFSKAQKIEQEDVCCCESLCNINPHIVSLSTVVALNLVHSKDFQTFPSESEFRSPSNFDVTFFFSVKEYTLSSKGMSDLDLVTSKSEILYSSIGSLNELRRIINGGSTLKISPINELCCLKFFEELNLSYCRQMNQSHRLHILFDAIIHLRELFMAGYSDPFKVPDIISTCSSLNYLGLNGSSIDSLPASIKNLPLLKTIYLRNCRRLLSIPQLPPSIMHLDATNCTSLETVAFSITISAAQQAEISSYFFSFVNCLKLNESSLCNIVDNAYLSLKKAVLNSLEASVFCYPSSTVPKWFRCKQAIEDSMAMRRSPAVDELLGFIFWAVLPRFTSDEISPTYLKCSCYLEDGEKPKLSSTCGYSITELYCDHVFMWYDRHYCKNIVEEVKSKLGRGETMPKVSFEFYVVTHDNDNVERAKHEYLIKECGVHPIYASEQQKELAPDSKMKTKWRLDEHGLFKGLVYSRKRKNKGSLTASGAVEEAELASNKATKMARAE